MGTERRLPPDPERRRFQLHFLVLALDFALPQLEQIQDMAQACGLPFHELRGELVLDQVRQLRKDVSDAIFAEVKRPG